MTYHMPIEQLLRHPGYLFQLSFAREAVSLLEAHEEIAFHPCGKGLLIQAVNEETLAPPVTRLQDIYGGKLDVSPPMVRYVDGTGTLEPVMHVRVSVTPACGPRVERDLERRGATILEEEQQRLAWVIRAVAPLAAIVGYADELAAMTHGRATLWTWLSHYTPCPPRDPGGAAA